MCPPEVRNELTQILRSYLLAGKPIMSAGEQSLGDVWILTIPGFQWFRAPEADLEEGRAFTSCGSVGRQLIMVGGVLSLGSGGWGVDDVDPWPQGVGVFDMTELKWKDEYSPMREEYISPMAVQEWYRQG